MHATFRMYNDVSSHAATVLLTASRIFKVVFHNPLHVMPSSTHIVPIWGSFLGVQPLDVCDALLVDIVDQICGVGWRELHSDEGKFRNRQVLCYGEMRHPGVKEFSLPNFSSLARTSQRSKKCENHILEGHVVIRGLRLDFEEISSSPLMAWRLFGYQNDTQA